MTSLTPIPQLVAIEYRSRCRSSQAIHEVVLDGHEKVSSVCYDNFPKHGGRPKADGAAKRRTNGWFMAVHPGKGLIVGLREMYHPENNAVAVQVMVEVTAEIHTVNCIVYDRMCSCLQAARSSTSLLMVKYWCIDKFHATGHGTNCPCSSLVHTRLERRLAKVNTSIAEQTFAWFRGYAGTFNTMSRETHYYVQKHNDLVMRQHIGHLNPWSKGRRGGASSRIKKRPVARPCVCRKPAGSSSSHPPVRRTIMKSHSNFRRPAANRA